MAVICNMPFAPWNDGRFENRMMQAMAEYTRLLSAGTCPMFDRIFERLVAEKNLAERRGEDTFRSTVFDEMVNSWSFFKRGTKVGLCRFFALWEACEQLLLDWTSRVVALMWLTTMLGHFEHTCFAAIVQRATFDVHLGHAESSAASSAAVHFDRTARSAPEDVAALRQASKNTLQLTLGLLADMMNYWKTAIMVFSAGPIRTWYHRQAGTRRKDSYGFSSSAKVSSGYT